jgi:hypothetical protein
MCWHLNADSDLLDFLVKVAKSPDLQAEYNRDPKALMEREGLPDKYHDVLLTQSRDEFLNAIARRQ